jgi:nicotinic acid phosphoribosyltransferase
MPANEDPSPMGITSILDTDLYKLTMQWAVLKSYPDAGAFMMVLSSAMTQANLRTRQHLFVHQPHPRPQADP